MSDLLPSVSCMCVLSFTPTWVPSGIVSYKTKHTFWAVTCLGLSFGIKFDRLLGTPDRQYGLYLKRALATRKYFLDKCQVQRHGKPGKGRRSCSVAALQFKIRVLNGIADGCYVGETSVRCITSL